MISSKCGVSLERTVKRHILNWMKKTSSRSHDKDQEQLTCPKTINYRTIFHTTCLPHSHDCPIIVNKNLKKTKTHDDFHVPLPFLFRIHLPFLFRGASTFVIPQSPAFFYFFCRALISYSAQ